MSPRRSMRKSKPRKRGGQNDSAAVEIDMSAMTLDDTKAEEEETSCSSSTDSSYSLVLDVLSDDSDDEDDLDDGEFFFDEPKKRERLVECRSNHPLRRKRFKNTQEWVEVTEGQVVGSITVCGISCTKSLRGSMFHTSRIPCLVTDSTS